MPDSHENSSNDCAINNQKENSRRAVRVGTRSDKVQTKLNWISDLGESAETVTGLIVKRSNGGQGRNRTADTRIFSPLLYRLSYLAKRCEPEILRKSSRESSFGHAPASFSTCRSTKSTT